MALATLQQFREYYPQGSGSALSDSLIRDVLDRAEAILELEIGYPLDDAAVETRTIYGSGSNFLTLPRHIADSVTEVTAPSGYLVPTYIKTAGGLAATTDGIYYRHLPGYSPAWIDGVPYAVTATWGTRATTADLTEACLELAVEIYRGRDSGFSGTVGVDGAGALVVAPTYPPRVARIIKLYRDAGITATTTIRVSRNG
jgi:hypothetical protein